MDLIVDGLREAVRILIHNEADVYDVAFRSLYVSGIATFLSLVVGVSIGAGLAFGHFRGRLFAMTLVNTGMGFPPVVIGLVAPPLLGRSGPFGALGWIYDPRGMIVAQTIIVTPIITGFTAAS